VFYSDATVSFRRPNRKQRTTDCLSMMRPSIISPSLSTNSRSLLFNASMICWSTSAVGSAAGSDAERPPSLASVNGLPTLVDAVASGDVWPDEEDWADGGSMSDEAPAADEVVARGGDAVYIGARSDGDGVCC
jgi:hypothetical protein